jgi:hypothetical protein
MMFYKCFLVKDDQMAHLVSKGDLMIYNKEL